MPGPNNAWNGLALLADISIDGGDGGPWRQALVSGLLSVKGIALDEDTDARSAEQPTAGVVVDRRDVQLD